MVSLGFSWLLITLHHGSKESLKSLIVGKVGEYVMLFL